MAEYTLDWNRYRDAAIRSAEEGAVLLRNEGGALPLARGTKVALFGRMQGNYYKSGTGSGGMVNVSRVVSILDGLREDGDIVLDGELLKIYEDWEADNPVDPGIGWGKENWSQKEMPLTSDLTDRMAAKNDAAVIVIGRTAGEDRDNLPEKGSFFLSDGEEEMLSLVCSSFDRTVVLLNVGNIIDMSFVSRYSPSAVLYVWQAGMCGGTAVANLVTGKANPSGALTDTIAYGIEDYPSTKNFGGADSFKDIYEEDIFVGYRYFASFAPDKVLYPFGSGSSYTTFALRDIGFHNDGTDVDVSITVENTGKVPGKKAVMLYASTPSGKLAVPARVLVDFAKTGELAPGECEVLKLKADAQKLASYDDDGRVTGETGWVLQEGEYVFYAGDDVSQAASVGSFTLGQDVMTERLTSALKPVESFRRLAGRDTYEDVPVRTIDHLKARPDRLPPEIPYTGDKGIKLADVKNGKNTLDEFTAQISDEELSLIIRGEGMSSPKVTTGTAAAFGGITEGLRAMGVPALCCDDGPSGMRLDSGKKAFSLPNGTCLASSFNEALNEELFEYFGIEMVSNGVDTILGPGINIHRNPLNGRNFEYFSEDPLLTGRIASAQIRGLEKHGVTATIKHFCANNRETNRREMDSVVSERALREIYLKGFEIAVKEGGARSIMSVYNMINGTYGTSNYDLNTVILRDQWGYEGILMTDWWAYIQQIPRDRFERGLTQHSIMARAQCDIYMVCSAVEAENLHESDCYENLVNGNTDLITRAELQRNAKNILRFALDTPAMDEICGNKPEVKHIDCPFADDAIEAKVDVYYDIVKTPEIEIDVDTENGKDFVFGVTCSEPGRYECDMTASSPLSPLAQLPVTIYYTSIPIRVITFNGTEDEDVTKTVPLLFISKYTIFRAHFGKRGLKLKKIRFRYLGPIDPEKDLEL